MLVNVLQAYTNFDTLKPSPLHYFFIEILLTTEHSCGTLITPDTYASRLMITLNRNPHTILQLQYSHSNPYRTLNGTPSGVLP